MTIDKICLFESFKESISGIDFAGGILVAAVDEETSPTEEGIVPVTVNNVFAKENTAFVTLDATILAAKRNGLLESVVA